MVFNNVQPNSVVN